MTRGHARAIYDWRPQRETPTKHGAKATNSRMANCDRNYGRCGLGILGALGGLRDGHVDTHAITRVAAGHIDA